MSWYEYGLARDLADSGVPVDALIMAAMLRADTTNLARLRAAFPLLGNELQARYHAPGGHLPTDPPRRAVDPEFVGPSAASAPVDVVVRRAMSGMRGPIGGAR